MPASDLDVTRIRAVFDLAMSRLFEDAELLAAAGLEAEAEDTYACAQALRTTRAQMLRRRCDQSHK